jgi:galactitol-specific phosphotransferase system IIB component
MSNNEFDIDKISDEEFEKLLDNVEDIEDIELESQEPSDSIEDTEHDSEVGSETDEESETNDDDQDTEEPSEEEPAEEDAENSQDEDDNEETELTQEQEEQLDSATEGMSEQEKIDYRKAYEEAVKEKAKYEDFYKQVTSEYVANGRVMKGFDDPKKIIQAQQMAAGFSEKMKSFKKYRPFINPLKEKGIIDNPDKFNLMLNALDGDKEAVKKLLKDNGIDPLELDMETIDYKPKNQLASDIEVAFEDVLDTANQYGVADKVQQVISKEWDDSSVIELLEDPESSADLVDHLSSGVYDLVQERIAQKKMADPYGAYSSKKAIDQYREAAFELEQEYMQQLQQQQMMQEQAQNQVQAQEQSTPFSEEQIRAEMERIRQEKQAQYAERVNSRNDEVDKARKKAASVSKRKPRSKPKRAEEFDPAKLSDEEFEELLNSFIQ